MDGCGKLSMSDSTDVAMVAMTECARLWPQGCLWSVLPS